MKSNNNIETDERFKELIRSARPEPDAAFGGALGETLAALPAKGGTRRGIPKPVIIIAVILLSLVIAAGAAYAAGAFKSGIFGDALGAVEERIEEFDSTYDDKRSRMAEMDEMEAAELDNEMDAESEQNAYDLVAMTEAKEHAVAINLESDGVELLVFSASVHEKYEPGWIWRIYLGFNAPEGYEYPHEVRILADGRDDWVMYRELTKLAVPTDDAKNPAIYEVTTQRNWYKLPGISEITVELDGRQWSFRYCWAEERLAQPGETDAPTTATPAPDDTPYPVSILSGYVADNGISVIIRSAEIRGERLMLELEVEVPESCLGKETRIDEVVLTIGGEEYNGEMLNYNYFSGHMEFSDETSRRPRMELWLPVPAAELTGREIPIALTLFTRYMPADRTYSNFELLIKVG